jgi:L,D-transpeptidase ErfK/SrfK
MKNKSLVRCSVILAVLAIAISCQSKKSAEKPEEPSPAPLKIDLFAAQGYVLVKDSVSLGDYFGYMDSVVSALDSLTPFALNEHILVAYNSWLIDTLAHTDYYWQKAHGKFVYDPQSMVVLKPGDSLAIPSAYAAMRLRRRFEQTVIDLNIPSFQLRVLVRDTVRHMFPVRVGQDGARYMAMAGRKVNMRTHPGEASIVRINKKARFVNPKDNREYKVTRRDDGKTTLLPTAIPWLEPGLNGTRYGQLIHPTTNPASLGKAYSNGCIGMGEGDMWRLYYHAPLGTKVRFRYELAERDMHGHLLTWTNIYPSWGSKPDTQKLAAQPGWNAEDESEQCCTCIY